MEEKLRKLIVVGDRVLIKPKNMSETTKGGLFLPPGYQEKEEIHSGYIMKVGPGFPIPFPGDDSDEPWKSDDNKTKYIPLQAQEGDIAIFLRKGALEVHYNDEKFFIVSQSSILLLERENDFS